MTFAHSAEVVTLKRRVEELEAVNAALRSQVETAMDDGERAISAVLKLELDLKCLEDSTVDAKAFEQLKAENAALRERLSLVSSRIGCGCGGDYGLCKSCAAALEAAQQEQKG